MNTNAAIATEVTAPEVAAIAAIAAVVTAETAVATDEVVADPAPAEVVADKPAKAPKAPKAVKEPVVKVPSKTSLALAIFNTKLAERAQGLFASNKDFRASVLEAIKTDLDVSTASAATMYNAAKKAAETADASVALGRDPKKVKVVSTETGKRGRPAGSKNAPKEADAEVAAVAAEADPVSEAIVINVAPAEAEAVAA